MTKPNWTWAVIYKDGSQHFEEDLIGFANVDNNQVQTLILHDQEQGLQFVTHIREGMRPIFFRRHRQEINSSGDTTLNLEPYLFATVFGWQKTIQGCNVKSLTWLLFDGSVAVTDCDLDDLI